MLHKANQKQQDEILDLRTKVRKLEHDAVQQFRNEERNVKTIPDIIDDIRYYWKRTKDVPLSWMEHMGSKYELLCLEEEMV